MVTNPRTTLCPHRVHPLNQPQPLQVRADDSGIPLAVMHKGRWVTIEEIQDHWRIDDEWWRKELSRLYYRVCLRDGRMLTIFHDVIEEGWFTQTVGLPGTQRTRLSSFAGRATKAASKERGDRRYANA